MPRTVLVPRLWTLVATLVVKSHSDPLLPGVRRDDGGPTVVEQDVSPRHTILWSPLGPGSSSRSVHVPASPRLLSSGALFHVPRSCSGEVSPELDRTGPGRVELLHSRNGRLRCQTTLDLTHRVEVWGCVRVEGYYQVNYSCRSVPGRTCRVTGVGSSRTQVQLSFGRSVFGSSGVTGHPFWFQVRLLPKQVLTVPRPSVSGTRTRVPVK